MLSSRLGGSSTCSFQDIGSARPSRHCKSEHLRLQKGQRKTYRKLPFHQQKAYCGVFFFVFSFFPPKPPPLQDYPGEQFTSLRIATPRSSFGDTWRLALNLNSWFVFGKALDTRAIRSPSPCHFSWNVLSRGEEEMRGGGEKKVAHITFTPPADKCVSFFWLWRKIGFGG